MHYNGPMAPCIRMHYKWQVAYTHNTFQHWGVGIHYNCICNTSYIGMHYNALQWRLARPYNTAQHWGVGITLQWQVAHPYNLIATRA